MAASNIQPCRLHVMSQEILSLGLIWQLSCQLVGILTFYRNPFLVFPKCLISRCSEYSEDTIFKSCQEKKEETGWIECIVITARNTRCPVKASRSMWRKENDRIGMARNPSKQPLHRKKQYPACSLSDDAYQVRQKQGDNNAGRLELGLGRDMAVYILFSEETVDQAKQPCFFNQKLLLLSPAPITALPSSLLQQQRHVGNHSNEIEKRQ